MRLSLLTFAMASLVAASVFAASAFNYADLTPRDVIATVVTDYNGYLAIGAYDPEYACYVTYTNGKIDLTWDGGSSCTTGANGTGVNPNSVYYFHDVLWITNKGTKTLENIWLNMSTDNLISIQTASSAGAMYTVNTYAQTATLTNVAPGTTYYIGFKVDASSKTTADSTISRTLSIEARSTA